MKPTIEYIFSLYEKYGAANYSGENISQLEHMSQAAVLAINQNYDDEVVLAAFFHDLGHLLAEEKALETMGNYGVKEHEKLGADFLRAAGFSERMATLVESHVPAKRYLTFKDEDYYNNLSDASKQTLAYQGGKMNATEANAFEQHPDFSLFITMRKWDEAAKEENMPLIDMNEIKERAKRLIK